MNINIRINENIKESLLNVCEKTNTTQTKFITNTIIHIECILSNIEQCNNMLKYVTSEEDIKFWNITKLECIKTLSYIGLTWNVKPKSKLYL